MIGRLGLEMDSFGWRKSASWHLEHCYDVFDLLVRILSGRKIATFFEAFIVPLAFGNTACVWLRGNNSRLVLARQLNGWFRDPTKEVNGTDGKGWHVVILVSRTMGGLGDGRAVLVGCSRLMQNCQRARRVPYLSRVTRESATLLGMFAAYYYVLVVYYVSYHTT